MTGRVVIRFVAVYCMALSLAACYYRRPDEVAPETWLAMRDTVWPRHLRFSQQQVLYLHAGLTPSQVEEIFGPPDRTVFKWMAALSMWPGPAMVYEYDMGWNPKGRYRYNTNRLVFATRDNPPYLVDWDIQLAYP
jgi:hypothetical protein